MMPQHFSFEKFKQVLHYIISKCYDRHNVGKTIIFKMLYFSDFDYYELNETPLTGEEYRKIDYGPAPRHFDKAMDELKDEGKIVELPEKTHDYTIFKFLALEKPELDSLSATEIKLIDGIIDKLSNMTAKQVVEYVHRDMPVKATEDGEIIDYELVFYRNGLFSVREYDDDERTIPTDS